MCVRFIVVCKKLAITHTRAYTFVIISTVSNSCEQTALLLLYMNLLQKQRGCVHKIVYMHMKRKKASFPLLYFCSRGGGGGGSIGGDEDEEKECSEIKQQIKKTQKKK